MGFKSLKNLFRASHSFFLFPCYIYSFFFFFLVLWFIGNHTECSNELWLISPFIVLGSRHPIGGLTTCNAVFHSIVPIYKTIPNWLITTEFSLLHRHSLFPSWGGLLNCSPLTNSANSWGSHLIPIFSLTPLRSHGDYSIIQLCPFSEFGVSLLVNANGSHLILCCLGFCLTFCIALMPHTRLLTPLTEAPNLVPLLCFPRARDSASCICRDLINTYLILEFLYQNDGYTIRRPYVIILWIIFCSAVCT